MKAFKLINLTFFILIFPLVYSQQKTEVEEIDLLIEELFFSQQELGELLNENNSKATFFVVGEVLKKNPDIFDKIISEGHEIGFHTMKHNRLDSFNFKSKFKKELEEFEKLTFGKSKGFRAPTFSLNKKSSWAINQTKR